MVGKIHITPALAAAFGAALYYYPAGLFGDGGLAGRIVFAVFFCAALVSFFRVLGEAPAFFFESRPSAVFPDGGAVRKKERDLSRVFRYTARLAAAFALGVFIGAGARAASPRGPFPGLPPETVTAVSGMLAEDPRTLQGGRGMGRVDLAYAVDGLGARAGARGSLPVYFSEENLPRVKEFGRGCTVYVEGNFTSGTDAGAGGRPYFRAVSVHVTKAASPLEQLRTGVRQRIARLAEIADGGRDGWSGLSLALLFGMKDTLDGDLAAAYRDAGCAHVLALSGMHLAVLSAMVVFLLKKPLGLRAAAVSCAVFVTAYVFVVGPQPSLNRAVIMYLLGTAAVLRGLHREPLNLLALSFLVQIILFPDSGTAVSFVLSYLALFGILTIGEALHELGRGGIPELILGPLSASAGAFIAVAPVTAYWFGVLRPAGIAAGLLVVPLATVFMALSIPVLFLAGIFPPAGRAVAAALSLLYRVQKGIVELAAAAPGLSPGSAPALAASLALTAVIFFFAYRVRRDRNRIPSFAGS
ncbi:MAG: ComEC/Rec2 family competence protein [Treponema sp.]|jgi:competence protein ComEC|nr:ComEC/Rec2 family competence protein [Treponema sp.]